MPMEFFKWIYQKSEEHSLLFTEQSDAWASYKDASSHVRVQAPIGWFFSNPALEPTN